MESTITTMRPIIIPLIQPDIQVGPNQVGLYDVTANCSEDAAVIKGRVLAVSTTDAINSALLNCPLCAEVLTGDSAEKASLASTT